MENGRNSYMRNDLHNYTSSQQSPRMWCSQTRKYKQSLYGSMFLEDFCHHFSSKLAPIGDHDRFYDVSPHDDHLKRLLLFCDYSALGYSFDELLSSVMHELLLNGKAYVEIVLWRDKQNVVQGMEFVPIHSVCYWVGNNTCRFSGKTYEGKKEKFSIEKQYLIIFDLKDLGFHRKYFRRLMNRLGSLGSAVTSGLINDPNLNGIYNFTEHQKRMDYELLKSTKKIFWLGRNYSNQHLSESYLLYRSAQYKSLFFRFLTYCLEQINKGIDFFSSELGYAGHIKAKYSQPDYETALTRYWKGEINVTDLNNFITPIAHNAKAEI